MRTMLAIPPLRAAINGHHINFIRVPWGGGGVDYSEFKGEEN